MAARLILLCALAGAGAAAEPSFDEILDPFSSAFPTGASRTKLRQAAFEKRCTGKGVGPAIRAMARFEKAIDGLKARYAKDRKAYLKSHAAWWGWRRKWEKASLKKTGLMPAEYPVPDGLNKDFIKKEETFKRSRSLLLRERILHERVLAHLRTMMTADDAIAAAAAGLRHKSVNQRLRCARLLRGVPADKTVAAARAKEKHPGVLAALMHAGDASIESFLTHPSWQVRAAAIRRAGRDAEKIEPLIAALEREDGRLKDDAADALRTRTGANLGSEPEQWRALAKDTAALSRPNPADPDPAAAPGVFSDGPVLFMAESRSRAFVFCLEASEPMIARLATKIGSLPDGVDFGIVLFGDAARVWKRKLTTAGSASRAAAQAWVKKQKPDGKADLYAGLDAAFELAGGEADTLYLVTSGPNTDTGLYDNPLQIYYEIEYRLLLSGIRVHAAGRSGGAQYFYLQRICNAFGGRLVTPG